MDFLLNNINYRNAQFEMADDRSDGAMRATPTIFSRSSRKYQSINPDRFEMEHDIGLSPGSAAMMDRVRMASPGESTEAGSRSQSPWLDQMSPSPNPQDSFIPVRGRHYSGQAARLLDPGQALESTTGLGVYQFSPPTTTTRHQNNSWLTKILKSKWSMIICLFLGLVGALAHHILYFTLHDREATNQQWWLRLGQLLAFIAKASFVVAVLIAHQQVAWRAVGQKSFSVHAVDSLFGAAHDAFELFNKEAWKKSWFVMFLAMYMWASPFVVIFTSATLNVVLDSKWEHVTCTSVRTLNFSNDAKKSWREPKRAENETLNGLSLSSFNEVTSNQTDPNAFDYWLKPSSALDSIAFRVLTGSQALQRDGVAKEICGEIWDCNTTIHFVGPGYRCQQLAKGADSKMGEFGSYEAPLNLSNLIPAAGFSYNTVADQGEYAPTQIEVDQKNIPVQLPPYPKNLGAFRTEPVIWLGYVQVDDVTVKHANASTQKGWREDYTPVITACEHWETNYTVELNYTGGLQTFNVVDRDYLRKIINTTFVNSSSSDGTLDTTLARPEENYVFPQDWENYRRVAAYHSLGSKLRRMLNGSIELPGPIGLSDITATKLIDRHETLPVPNFEDKVRNLYENLLISLLSDPQLLAVSWASNPSRLSGTGIGGSDTAYPCTLTRTTNYFFYHWQILVCVYAASFIVAAVAVTYAILAMRRDGVEELREMTFSAIARATKGMNLGQDGDGRRRTIRAVEERPGSGLYEFRVEDYNGSIGR